MKSDLLPVYTALIRRELRLQGGSQPLDCLEARLTSRDPRSRPPYRAPAIVRLRKALKRLRADKEPLTLPEQFADDLRFLQLFAPGQPILTADGARKLLADIIEEDDSIERKSGQRALLSMNRGRRNSGGTE
jgi:hypothetical protein